MKLISFNIDIFTENSKEVADFIKKENPDIVAFQEIIRHFDDTVFLKYQSQKRIHKIIKDKLKYSFFGPQWITDMNIKNNKIHREYGGFIEQGNEILSKFPITSAVNEHYHKNYQYDFDRTKFYEEDHPRCIQIVKLNINGKTLRILNLHGTYSIDKLDTQRSIKQSEYILEIIARENLPTIIVGDFNLLPQTKSIQMLNKKFRNLTTEYNIKSTRPYINNKKDTGNNIVDYVFVDDSIKIETFKVTNTDISDHLPLILDFDLK